MPAVFEISSHDTLHDQRSKKPFSSRNYFDLKLTTSAGCMEYVRHTFRGYVIDSLSNGGPVRSLLSPKISTSDG